MPTAELACNLGGSVVSKVRHSSRDIALRTEELAASSRACVADQLVSARAWTIIGRDALRASTINAADLAGRTYVRGKRVASDRRVQQIAGMLATLAVAAAVRRQPAGALALSVMESMARSSVFRRGRPASAQWQVDLVRLAGKHTWKRIGQTGGLACFTYVDANGVVTERMVRNWRSTGRLIRGHCLLRQQFRCFRIDRIEGWSEAE